MSEASDSILRGARQALAYVRGETRDVVVHKVEVADVDVRRIRRHLSLSQKAFAERFGFSLKSVRNWEQGVRRPEGPARLLLLVIEREPEVVDRVLAETRVGAG